MELKIGKGLSFSAFSLQEQLGIYAIWYVPSIIGGCLGGIIGYLCKKTPYVLLSLLFGIILQLFVNGAGSWKNIIGIAQNSTFCLMIVSIVGYLITVKRKNRDV